MNWQFDKRFHIGRIFGVIVKKLNVFEDDRGFVFESVRTDWEECYDLLNNSSIIDDSRNIIEQVYIVQNKGEAIRAFHVHEELVDLFCITNGYAKFVLFDDRKESPTFGFLQIINASDKIPQLIGVPAGVFHGWKGSAGCTLVSVANRLYMGKDRKEKLDEERICWDIFGKEIWETEFK